MTSEIENVNEYESLSLYEAEIKLIYAALKRCNGSVVNAAKHLGITRGSLYNKFQRRGLSIRDWKNR